MCSQLWASRPGAGRERSEEREKHGAKYQHLVVFAVHVRILNHSNALWLAVKSMVHLSPSGASLVLPSFITSEARERGKRKGEGVPFELEGVPEGTNPCSLVLQASNARSMSWRCFLRLIGHKNGGTGGIPPTASCPTPVATYQAIDNTYCIQLTDPLPFTTFVV